MSKQVSKLFLSNISVVDHAYIDNRGNVVGGSYNPSFLVSGEIDPVEQVVVDFSSVKKQIKQIIDDKETGFDHKLWFIHGYSNGTVSQMASGHVVINTPTTKLTMPANAVKCVAGGEYLPTDIGNHIGEYVQYELAKLHPKVGIVVECNNSIDCHVPSGNDALSLFRYAHGLKSSTSWGCKNIAHGHLSYIQIESPDERLPSVRRRIAQDLDDTIFVYDENILAEDNERIIIGYDTPERGRFEAVYMKDAYNIVVLVTETTVENLIEYVAAQFADELTSIGATRLLISEGLSKGACITFEA